MRAERRRFSITNRDRARRYHPFRSGDLAACRCEHRATAELLSRAGGCERRPDLIVGMPRPVRLWARDPVLAQPFEARRTADLRPGRGSVRYPQRVKWQAIVGCRRGLSQAHGGSARTERPFSSTTAQQLDLCRSSLGVPTPRLSTCAGPLCTFFFANFRQHFAPLPDFSYDLETLAVTIPLRRYAQSTRAPGRVHR